MPLLADSIVECGRKTLTNAILLANEWGKDENGRWKGAHVVYGTYTKQIIDIKNLDQVGNSSLKSMCIKYR